VRTTKKAADQNQKSEKTLQVNVRLTGRDAERFLRYKDDQKLKTAAAATYKLIFERLDQIEAA
jgi:hypothetical protein